ncbi:MAG: hypothetical protein A2X48_07360 [Lentisphaerae bacterium GWF2_49_21]|nr:MAG: hypothetical protein A2X48_07360 [Lentisphaerae bacterium GWF2_49_21]
MGLKNRKTVFLNNIKRKMEEEIQNKDKSTGELIEAELEDKVGRADKKWSGVRMGRTCLRLLLLAVFALLYAAAFPPLNWSSVGWFGITPLFLMVRGRTVRQAWFDGFFGDMSGRARHFLYA